MKVYTKKGDQGLTSLIGGTKVPKNHIRIEAYGTVDELNSWVGLLRDNIPQSGHTGFLLEIQDRLFTIGSLLAADPETSRMKLPQLSETDVEALEKKIDEMDAVLPRMRSFVLPGGHPAISISHITRCVCRRAERDVVHLSETSPPDPLIIKYLNRLSDYFFVLSRKLTLELGSDESPWSPRM